MSESKPERRRGRRRENRVPVAKRQKSQQHGVMLFVGVIGAGLLIALALILFSGTDDDSVEHPDVQAQEVNYGDIPTQGMSLGDPDAPVQLTEWADYQ